MQHAILGLCLGIVECLLGLVLIIFGFLSWKAAESWFLWFDHLRREHRRNQCGFVIAPALYLIGIIGVLTGVMASGYSQILKSGQVVQNGMTVKSDLQASANTLSAQGVFSTDGLTLCPPRSTHQSNGNPCTTAPISLIQFSDYTGSQLPANYVNATSTGSPAEVGIFAAGAGIKILDPYGHAYIYCRWENTRSNPAANAFVLLSAGADGNLQTKCGDTSAQGDDAYLSISVAAAINRAALWQANGSSNVSYGATGSQVVIDSSGNLTAAGALNASSAVLANDLTVASVNASGNVTSSGVVSGASGSFGNLNATTVTTTGALSVAGSTSLKAVTTKALTSTGNTTGTNATYSGTVTAASFSGSGAGLTNIPASAITGATGGGQSQWITSGSEIYYSSGPVIVGGTTPYDTSQGVSAYTTGSAAIYGANSGAGSGVYGTNDSSGGAGVQGFNSSTGYGVEGYNTAAGYGVWGYSTSGYGVFGRSSNNGYGIYGYNQNAGYALYGDNASTGQGNGYGVYGTSWSGIGGYFTSTSGYALITGTGKVGIGTPTPVATLDVKGFVRLAAQSSAPTTCTSTTKGSIALASSAGRLCVCSGISWVFDYSGSACTW